MKTIETRRDYTIAFWIGLISSMVWFFALGHLALLSQGKLAVAVLLLPVFFVVSIAANRKIFKSPLIHKGIKFLIVGILNTGIDFFIFNTLIAFTGIDNGIFVLVFKSISFLIALLNSYELNRWWTFDKAAASRNKKEFARFLGVTLISFLVNVGATAIIANVFHPLFGMSQVRWDNVAALAATGLNLVLNFIGYKLFVFNIDVY
jgi:putative flippase GtrA